MINNCALTTSRILNLLISRANITEATLVKETGVPRATINRLTSGKTPDPRSSTLSLIADYFNVSIDQLLGKVAIDFSANHTKAASLQSTIPILSWQNIGNWQSLTESMTSAEHDLTSIDAGSEQGKYAVRVTGEAMWPQFQENTLLIVQPTTSANNRDFVLAYLAEKQQFLFRQLIVDSGYRLLVPINSRFPDITMTDADEIVGIVIQARNNLV